MEEVYLRKGGGGSILGIEGKTMVGDWKFIRRMRNQSMPPD